MPLVSTDLGMTEVFHTHPCNDNPDPGHNTGQYHKSGIVAYDRQGRIVLELWWCVWRCAYIPCPAPDIEARPHADNVHEQSA